jgi:segregation and condensation protein B
MNGASVVSEERRFFISGAPFSPRMSLKAKIEAVIYAAEEPVTPAQLAALFQSEILEAREARLSAEAAAKQEAAEVQPESPALVLEGELALLEDSSETIAPSEPAAEAEAIPGDGLAAQETGEPVAAEPAAAQADDEKRAARQRDREIRDELRGILDALIAEYAESDRGMEIREIAGGYRVATKPEYHDAVRGFVKSLKPPMKLSLQALETLAVIAYKQPVTAPEVSEIRGVDSGGVLGSLVSRKLITTAGRKQVIGRPILYKTTKEFLLRFGLKDLNELPSIEEFEKMAGELADVDEAAEPESAKAELPFELDGAVEAGEIPEDGEDGDDAEARAAAVASVGVSDESESHDGSDVPGVEADGVETEAEAAAGQSGERD